MDQITVENQKKLLSSILINRLLEGKNTVIYRELMDEELPVFLKNYLRNRVQKIYNTEEPFQINNSKRFDLNYHKIDQLTQELKSAFEDATLFTKEEIEEIILRTVGLQFDLLTSPAETLQKIFFQNKSEHTQTEILRIIEGLEDRRIFMGKLINNIRQFDQYHILSENFNEMLESTINEAYTKDLYISLISDFESFLEFQKSIENKKVKLLKKNIIKLMLEKRHVEHLYQLIIKIDKDSESLNIEDIKKGLSENRVDNDSYPTDHTYSDNDKLEIVEPTAHSEFREEDDLAYELQDADSISIESEKHHPIIKDCKEPQDFIIDRSMIEYQPDIPLVSLNSLFDEKSKKMIKKKIFKKDSEAYNKFLDRLENVDNWKEAKHIIDYELMIRSIQPFSREALRLGDLVFNRYFPQKE